MTKKLNICYVAVLLAAYSPVAVAQNAQQANASCKFYRPVPPLPPELAFSYHHASTAREGALRGQAQLIHAFGSYELAKSQAMICREEAKTSALANRQLWLEHCVAYRSNLESRRQQRIAEKLDCNQAVRLVRFAVYRLSSNQLDRSTGTISWPRPLQASEYESLRWQLEDLFRNKAVKGAITYETAEEIVRQSRTLGDALLQNQSSIDRNEYLAARKFLCGLKYEAESTVAGDPRTMTTTAPTPPLRPLN